MKVSFLGAGPVFDVDLTGLDFEWVETSTVVDFGRGSREVIFVPAGREPTDDSTGYIRLRADTTRSGLPITSYLRVGEPRIWEVCVSLGDRGSVWTHIREEDGEETVGLVLSTLDVHWVADVLTPVLSLGRPARVVPARMPGHAETILFIPPDQRREVSLELRRPSFIDGHRSYRLPESQVGAQIVLRGGGNEGVEIRVVAPVGKDDDAYGLLRRAANLASI